MTGLPIFALLLATLALPPGIPGDLGDPGDITVVSTNDFGIKGNGNSEFPQFSRDGSKVVFKTNSTNFDDRDQDFLFDVYEKDLTRGDVTLVSVNAGGVKANADSRFFSVSDDGTKVAFDSDATNLDPNDPDDYTDIYVKDLVSGELVLASTSFTGVKSDFNSFSPSISADGTLVAFVSYATNLDPRDSDGFVDIYVKDLVTGDITLASTSDADVKGNAGSDQASLSADGTRVAFTSSATNLDRHDRDDVVDVYVKNLTTGDIELASTTSSGIKGNENSWTPSLSSSGTQVAFFSYATNLDPADPDDLQDVYVKDLETKVLVLASTSSQGVKGNGDSLFVDLSADGQRVAFLSSATNLHPRDGDPFIDVYVKDLRRGGIYLATTSDHRRKPKGGVPDAPRLTADGKAVAFGTTSTLEPPADSDHLYDVYVKTIG